MRSRWLVLAVVGLLVLGAIPFTADVSGQAQPNPVLFDDTITTGMPSSVVQQAQESAFVIPKTQVFYSEYKYVVGYYGVSSLVATFQTGPKRGFGRPMTVYVTGLSADAELNEKGYPIIPGIQKGSWIDARNAYYVVNSRARLPTRENVILPFDERQTAQAFAQKYGGEVRQWDELRTLSLGELTRSRQGWQRVVQSRSAHANRTVQASRALLTRPVSIVVGQDAPTVQAAIDRAPPNTTVRLPAGTYNVDTIRIRKPLTLVGAGRSATHLEGDGNGSVVKISAPRTAITRLSISGVGPQRGGGNNVTSNISVNKSAWNYNMRKVHGYGDAAIVFDTANRSLVSQVTINTTSNGVIVRDSPHTTIANVTVYGTKRWGEGFLGVSVLGSPIVVQDSRFYGGKVGVWAHGVSGMVVRGSRMEGGMIGVFNLFGQGALITNNTVEDTGFGIAVKTRAYNVAVAGNQINNSATAIVVEGTANYVAGNVVTKATRAVIVEGHFSLYTYNVFAYSKVGMEGLELLPTNRVTANDIVANRRPATTSAYNILHVWRGNYWSDAPGLRTTRDGHLVRGYRPTGPVDRAIGKQQYARTLASSPALTLIRQLQANLPGLQANGLVDPAPLARPVHPEQVRETHAKFGQTGRGEDADSWDYLA